MNDLHIDRALNWREQQQAQRIAELEAQLAAEREAKQHETKRAQALMQERNKLRGELDLSNEAIGLVRQHLQSVGISAEFVDDVAAIAAYRLNVVRQSRARLVEFVRYRARELENADEFIRDIEAERDAAREETEQAQGHAVAYLHRANEAEQDAQALAYRIDDMGDFWDWETKEKDLEIARKYIKDGEQ